MRQPTLIIHSAYDRATDYSATKKVAENLKNNTQVRLVTLRKTNHIVMWDYEAQLAEKEILRFVNDVPWISSGETKEEATIKR